MAQRTKQQGYPSSDQDADSRYQNWKEKDPYPEVAAALLNSADIKAYVKTTGMIYPFDEEELQSASYKVKIGGKVIYWEYDEQSKNKIQKVELNLTTQLDGFDLAPNSIAFVELEPCFRIPEYMALRFNLKIKHIYKGLLLGTGPLVDPGFVGKLFIPLHNLTHNTYHFKYGDTLITMEFTKLSGNNKWGNLLGKSQHNETYKAESIPPQRTVEKYLENALYNDRLDSVYSSIPDALNEGKAQVKQAQKEAATIRKWSVGTSIASFIAIAGLIYSTINLTLSGYNKVNEQYNTIIKEYIERMISYENCISELEGKIEELESELSELTLNTINYETSDNGE